MPSELERRRFMRIANRIGRNASVFEAAIREMNGCAAELHRLIGDYAERLKKVPGIDSSAIDRVIAENNAALSAFVSPEVIPALDATLQTFGDCATSLAGMVSALPAEE